MNLSNAKAVMRATIPLKADMFRYDLREWVKADEGSVIDVTVNKAVIRKFKPNVMLLHSPVAIKDTSGSGNTAICAYTAGAMIKVSGIAALTDIFNGYKTLTNNHGAGSDLPKCKGLCMYPYSTDGFLMMERMYTWENCWSAADKRDLTQVADWQTFKHDGSGHGSYGIFHDYEKIATVPANLYDFNTWARANNGTTNSWYFGFGLYTSNTTAVDADGYIDISDRPITIELIATGGIDITTQGVWKMGSVHGIIYEKPRNLQNLWMRYGLATQKNGYITLDAHTCKDMPSYKIPLPIDWRDHIMTDNSYICWNCKPANTDIWNEVREWYKSHTIRIGMLDNGPTKWPVQEKPSIFYNSGFNGEVELHIYEDEYFLAANDAFYGSDIHSVKFVIESESTITAPHNLFRHADKLEQVETNVSFGATDISGMFEFCAALKSIPSNMCRWGAYSSVAHQTNIPTLNTGYAFEYSGLERIPIYNENGDIVAEDHASRYYSNNTLTPIFADQMFNGCLSLTYVGPLLDFVALIPSSANKCFNGAPIVDMRIKRLNHGDWRFDGTTSGDVGHGNLTSLNTASVQYLMNNLCDLTQYDASKHEADCTNPRVSAASIYCPSEWSDKITSAMLTAAKAKGWTIYIGGTISN